MAQLGGDPIVAPVLSVVCRSSSGVGVGVGEPVGDDLGDLGVAPPE